MLMLLSLKQRAQIVEQPGHEISLIKDHSSPSST